VVDIAARIVVTCARPMRSFAVREAHTAGTVRLTAYDRLRAVDEAEPEPESPIQHSTAMRSATSTESWALPLTASSNPTNEETFYPQVDGRVLTVPLDSRPALVFNRNVEDVAGVGTPGPFSDAEGALFDHLLYGLLGSATRPLPLRPQLTALRTDGASDGPGGVAEGAAVALLLELPEAVEWDRLSLAIAGAAGPVEVALVRSLDLTRAVLLLPDPDGDPCSLPWEAGDFQVTLVYHLQREDGTGPVLTRRGSSRSEAPPAIAITLP
jgi:hypothetical protein